MAYVLGSRSLGNLSVVHPSLVAVVRKAITLTEQDFAVFEGLRTLERQRKYVARGVSKTMHSKHLRQPSGYGHAVNLVPWVDDGLRWEWGPIYYIAWAMAQAAQVESVKLVWGGVWDRQMYTYAEGIGAIKHEVAAYCARHPGPDFIDGPNFQLA